jgi:hypothetical protein
MKLDRSCIKRHVLTKVPTFLFQKGYYTVDGDGKIAGRLQQSGRLEYKALDFPAREGNISLLQLQTGCWFSTRLPTQWEGIKFRWG